MSDRDPNRYSVLPGGVRVPPGPLQRADQSSLTRTALDAEMRAKPHQPLRKVWWRCMVERLFGKG